MRNFMVFDVGGSSTKWSIIDELGDFKESNKFSFLKYSRRIF